MSQGKPGVSATPEEMAQAEKLLEGGAAPAAGSAPAAAQGGGHDAGHGGGHGAGHVTGNDAGAEASKKPSGKVKKVVDALAAQAKEIVRGLRSPDRPTRRASVFFFASLGILGVLVFLTIQHSAQVKREKLAQEELAHEQVEAHREEAELYSGESHSEHGEAVPMLSIGQFTIELKPIADRPRKGGFMDMAEIELVVECDSKNTRALIEDNLVQARSQVTDLLVSFDREELLSRDGKARLKKRLIDKLNGWLPRGKIRNIFFSKLVVA